MKFAEYAKIIVSESIKEQILPDRIFDSSVNRAVFNKNRERIEFKLEKYDLLANELKDQPGKFYFQTRISNIGVEHYAPITGQEGNSGSQPLKREVFGEFQAWKQEEQKPKDTNILNIIMDKNYKIEKVYAGRLREKSQEFLDKYKYVGP